ncbi:hypothetical protein dsx2_0535 [Desulfovibrio sp. X2]|uniref:hypothetical protein n=1 Tax=Desulfovibrio sp. X2 TaxID=941449 RepID=UPI0003587E4A|nr:hypothetical protein [Desulfovibrio sp. X2]EPR38726.1 hypothetical protein dsx2_0535 [Desulfovibrio sp. X2]
MLWIEAIILRSFAPDDRQDTTAMLREVLRTASAPGLARYRICHEAVVSTDLIVFLTWQQPGPPEKSKLGLHLAILLRDFGLVYHTLWIDESDATPA